MKKVLLVLLLSITLLLSGCENEPQEIKVRKNEICLIDEQGLYDCSIYYTQEEVDEIIQHLFDTYIVKNREEIEELKLLIEELEEE